MAFTSSARAWSEWGWPSERKDRCKWKRARRNWGLQKEAGCVRVCACVCARMLRLFRRVRLFATLWTVAPQAPLSMGFSRQEYWRGFPCPPPGDLPDSGIEPVSPLAPAFQVDSLLLSHQGTPGLIIIVLLLPL